MHFETDTETFGRWSQSLRPVLRPLGLAPLCPRGNYQDPKTPVQKGLSNLHFDNIFICISYPKTNNWTCNYYNTVFSINKTVKDDFGLP